MKQTLLIAAAVAATGIGAHAQGLLERPNTQGPTVTTEAKTTADLYRIIGLPTYKYDGAEFKPQDSMGLTYSGIRGGMIVVDLNALIFPSSDLPLKPDVQGGYAYNTGTASWEKNNQILSTYDTRQNLQTTTSQSWNGASWDNTNKNTYTFDANNNNTEIITQDWNGSAWENYRKTINTFNSSNLLTESVQQGWDGSAWVNGNKEINTYTANGRPETKIKQSWSSGAWLNTNKTIYNYGTSNLYPDDIITQNWSSGSWNNVNKQVLTYSAPNVLQTSVSQSWSGSAWENSSRSELTTNASGSITTAISANWDGSAWKNSSKVNYGFNSNGLVSTYDVQSWNAGGFWEYGVGAIKQTVYYEMYTNSVTEVTGTTGKLNVYPNPALSVINVNMEWEKAQEFTVVVYDMQGRAVKQFSEQATQNYNKAIATDDLAMGNYMLVVKSQGNQITKPFSVIK